MTKSCRFCTEEFMPLPGKPGRIDVCYDPVCQRKDRRQMPEPPLKMATVAWSGKHTPEITITDDRKMAMAFNAAGRRFGHGPNLRFSPSVSFADTQD